VPGIARVLDKDGPLTMRAELCLFYRLGQTDKISLAAA
jgi:hypothetical protein